MGCLALGGSMDSWPVVTSGETEYVSSAACRRTDSVGEDCQEFSSSISVFSRR